MAKGTTQDQTEKAKKREPREKFIDPVGIYSPITKRSVVTDGEWLPDDAREAIEHERNSRR